MMIGQRSFDSKQHPGSRLCYVVLQLILTLTRVGNYGEKNTAQQGVWAKKDQNQNNMFMLFPTVCSQIHECECHSNNFLSGEIAVFHWRQIHFDTITRIACLSVGPVFLTVALAADFILYTQYITN